MPQMWRLSFQWDDNTGATDKQKYAFVTSEEDAIPELNNAIGQIVASGLGDSLSINATRLGELRGTPG